MNIEVRLKKKLILMGEMQRKQHKIFTDDIIFSLNDEI